MSRRATTRFARSQRHAGSGSGLVCAFNPETAVEDAVAAASGVDLVLCMSIHPGYSGQELMPDAIGRIETARALLPADVRVQVDGGINRETIDRAYVAGAHLLVAGSAVFWRDDPPAAYAELRAQIALRDGA